MNLLNASHDAMKYVAIASFLVPPLKQPFLLCLRFLVDRERVNAFFEVYLNDRYVLLLLQLIVDIRSNLFFVLP